MTFNNKTYRNLTITSLIAAILITSGLIITSGIEEAEANSPSGNHWKHNAGSDTYYDTGNVGIGTSTPGAPLQVIGNATFGYVDNIASGNNAAAFGDATTASSTNSAAFGYNTTASGTDSAAFGSVTTASGGSSAAFGGITTASGTSSAAFGGITTASGTRSAAFGWDTTASGINSAAFGDATTASGINSAAFGQYTDASGDNSAAFGQYTDASGDNSAAFGWFTTASGVRSATFGGATTASGIYSAAFGGATIASGVRSAAFGSFTTTQSYASFVIGQYNEISGNSTAWITTDPLFVIGNGANSTSTNNAVTVLKNGNVGIGNSSPNSALDVSGGYIELDTISGAPPSADCNASDEYGRMKVDNKPATSNLYVCTPNGWGTLTADTGF